MALSDTLFEAAEEIRRYRAEYPGWYEEHAKALDELLGLMDMVRFGLDSPPLPRHKATIQWP